ncbi:hypothetical protein BAL199_16278 [alpha proteobacterium BAL199]|jgi:hypothetical protein|nr:hypothetical protein BAL199_16278 [alpha proteobacterium BAL199]
MRELLRTNDLVRLSYLEALLKAESIEVMILDGHTSVLEGSAGAIPRRLMVDEEDYHAARQTLEAVGERLDER